MFRRRFRRYGRRRSYGRRYIPRRRYGRARRRYIIAGQRW